MANGKKIILIVEDEIPMLNILRDKLQEVDFATFQAKDGVEGLQLAFAHHPDLILLDLLMPKMDGMTMLNKLRKDNWGKNVPVVILTNVNPDADTTLKAIVDTQPAYYLVKSDIKLEDVVEKVKQIVKGSSR